MRNIINVPKITLAIVVLVGLSVSLTVINTAKGYQGYVKKCMRDPDRHVYTDRYPREC